MEAKNLQGQIASNELVFTDSIPPAWVVVTGRCYAIRGHTGTPAARLVPLILAAVCPDWARDEKLARRFMGRRPALHFGDLTNAVVEVKYAGTRVICSEPDLPKAGR